MDENARMEEYLNYVLKEKEEAERNTEEALQEKADSDKKLAFLSQQNTELQFLRSARPSNDPFVAELEQQLEFSQETIFHLKDAMKKNTDHLQEELNFFKQRQEKFKTKYLAAKIQLSDQENQVSSGKNSTDRLAEFEMEQLR